MLQQKHTTGHQFAIGEKERIVKNWEEFYNKYLGIKVDFSDVYIPRKMPGNWRLLFIPQGLDIDTVVKACKKAFELFQYEDNLNAIVTVNTRTSEKSYAVWTMVSKEPDNAYIGKSAQTADPIHENGITILERLVFELKHYSETSEHMDIRGTTFCSGSYDTNGFVLAVGTFGKRFGIRSYGTNSTEQKSGIRRVIWH